MSKLSFIELALRGEVLSDEIDDFVFQLAFGDRGCGLRHSGGRGDGCLLPPCQGTAGAKRSDNSHEDSCHDPTPSGAVCGIMSKDLQIFVGALSAWRSEGQNYQKQQ